MVFDPPELDEDEELASPAPRVVGREWEDLSWQDRAACAHEGPDLFIGPSDEPHEARHAREQFALDAFCATCPVRARCTSFAREHREHGVWGETEAERARAGFTPMHTTQKDAVRADRFARMAREGMIAR